MDLMNTEEAAIRFVELWSTDQQEILQSELNEAFADLAFYRGGGPFGGSWGAIEHTMRDLEGVISEARKSRIITQDSRLAMVAYRAAAHAAEVLYSARG